MLHVKNLLAKMLTLLDGYLVVEERTLNFSFRNQRYGGFQLDVSKTGYTPLGVVGYTFSAVDWFCSNVDLQATPASLFIFRNSNITASASLTLRILYCKD